MRPTLLTPFALVALVAATASAQMPGPSTPPNELRTIDGTRNNRENPLWGSAGAALLRTSPAAYGDGASSPAGADRPSARAVSNAVADQPTSLLDPSGASDFVWQWGQFLDHDITLTPVLSPAEVLSIPVPAGDAFFDPFHTGTATIPLDRSYYELDADGVRQQFNEITSFIDASNVYGSDVARANELRTMDGTGKLKTGSADLLPFNVNGLPNAPSADPSFFLAGDFRANEQAGLTAMHVLFVREHNYWAERIAAQQGDGQGGGQGDGNGSGRRDSRQRRSREGAGPGSGGPGGGGPDGGGPGGGSLTGDEIYEAARTIVAAEMQAISYREFLPVVLGRDALGPYAGYRQDVDATISNEFATAAYRFGHTMLSPTLLRIDGNGQTAPQGDLSLAAAFFNPANLLDGGGIDPLLRGLATQRAQRVDTLLVDDVRNFLFGPPGAGGFDLAALNIARGRDHGLADYNEVRRSYGLAERQGFRGITSDAALARSLRRLYRSIDDVDLWVAGLAEDRIQGALVGETFRAILVKQFEALRDGDRFWYQRSLPPGLVRLVNEQTLARVIRRNTGIGDELQRDVFHARNP
jgi:hypothetical protein